MPRRRRTADGGNSDPTSTHGKDPRTRQGDRAHGDAAGVGGLRQNLTNWLTDMALIEAGALSQVGAYVGCMKPYATSHDELDADTAFQEEVRNAARSLMQAVKLMRRGELKQPDAGLHPPRQK